MSKTKAFVRYTKTGEIIPGSLIISTTGELPKSKGGVYYEVPMDLCCEPQPEPPTIQALRLTFDSIENANILVGDASNVNDWNTFFDLPVLGTPFTSVEIIGNEARLFGGSNIKVKPSLFYNVYNTNNVILTGVDDQTGCITSVGGDAFSYCYDLTDVNLPNCTIVYGSDDSPQNDYGGFGNCTNLVNVSIPELVTAGNYAFGDCSGLTEIDFPELTSTGYGCFGGFSSLISVNLPKLINAEINSFQACTSLTSVDLPLATQIGDYCFFFCTNLINISLPSCVNLGSTVGNDGIFGGITGNTVTLTIPSALMTCNSGSPDGDIQGLQATNTVTIITV